MYASYTYIYIYIYIVCTKSASRNSPNKFSTFPDMYSYSVLSYKCPKTSLNFINT